MKKITIVLTEDADSINLEVDMDPPLGEQSESLKNAFGLMLKAVNFKPEHLVSANGVEV